MAYTLNSHKITIVNFRAMGYPCTKEVHDVDEGRISERHRTHFRVRVEEIPGLRGARLDRLMREANDLEKLLDMIEAQ